MQGLRIIPIGGTTTVQKNMYVYEYGDDIIVMDCGIGFPDEDTPGIDVIIPDFTYVLENRHKVRGIVITHGHDDHRSSLPFLLKEHKFDVYAVPFVKGLIEKGLEEHTNLDNVQIKTFYPNQPLRLGVFTLHPFRVNHSIPDTLGFAIDTPEGRVFHNSDFKFDWSPVMDKPFDVQRAAQLASEHPNGVLALLSDCLGSTSEGFTESESKIQEQFEKIMAKSRGKQVFITTISSNISRMDQAIRASAKYGRKVVIVGRSMRNTIEVAREHKYIDFPEKFFVEERNASRHKQSLLTYIIAGCYGQKNSGLSRVAIGEHKTITMEPKGVVVFSADPIPNSVSAINRLVDELYRRDAEVYYSEIQDNLHVSGHGGRGDLTLLANIVRPKYYIPIGGNIKHMRAYSMMIQDLGVEEKRILQLDDGQSVVFRNNQAQLGEKLKLKEVYVDGNLVGDIGPQVINDRIKMSQQGMVVVVAGKNVDIVTRGFVFVKESQKLLNDAKGIVYNDLKDTKTPKTELKNKIERDLSKFFFKETGREPLVLVTMA